MKFILGIKTSERDSIFKNLREVDFVMKNRLQDNVDKMPLLGWDCSSAGGVQAWHA